jgi:CheY-like chemotaxis protein
MRILIIDDDDDELMLLSDSLRNLSDITIHTTKNLLRLDCLELDDYDVFLIDYFLGSFRGTEIAKMIKKNQPDALIGLISGATDSHILHDDVSQTPEINFVCSKELLMSESTHNVNIIREYLNNYENLSQFPGCYLVLKTKVVRELQWVDKTVGTII